MSADIRPLELRGKAVTAEAMLHAMQTIRAVETALRDAYLQNRFEGPLHVSLGQEHAAVGVATGIGAEDVLVSNHRGHGHALAFGLDPRRVVAEIVGDPCGYAGGRGGSMHIFEPKAGFLGTNGIVGDGAGLAVGAALALKQLHRDAVVVGIIGDGAMGTGIVYESFNLASLWRLPIVFVCENNGYAEMTPTTVHLSTAPSGRAEAFGLRVFRVEEEGDVRSITKTMKSAAMQAREGNPTFIEVLTYRWGGHYVGDPAVYRPKGEEESWRKQHDPIRTLGAKLGLTEEEVDAQNALLLQAAEKVVADILAHAHRT